MPQTEQQRWQSRKSRSRERENKLSNRERTAHSLGEKEMGHHCSTYPFLTLQRVQKKSKHALAILTHKSWTKLSSKHLQGLTAKPTCMGQLTAGWVLQTQIKWVCLGRHYAGHLHSSSPLLMHSFVFLLIDPCPANLKLSPNSHLPLRKTSFVAKGPQKKDNIQYYDLNL